MLIALVLAAASLSVEVDMRESPRRLIHAKLSLSAEPGDATWVYPKWVPGEHAPRGSIADLANLSFTAQGKPLAWVRDPEDMYAFHVTVPKGVDHVDATLDFFSEPPTPDMTASFDATTTPTMALLGWYHVVLYPRGVPASQVAVKASIQYPAGWKWGSSLLATADGNGRVTFAPVDLETLVDSPVAMGRFTREYALGTLHGAPHALFLVADSEEALAMPPEVEASYKKLVDEAIALFGARHYDRYRFLLMLSDQVNGWGLEHHRSSENRFREHALVDPELRLAMGDLLPHEYAHSWNGKFRRPARLYTPDYQAPMHGDLLWVYEGLTNYLGNVLAARAGVWSPDDFRANLALCAADVESHGGRAWRPLADTATASQVLYFVARPDWAARRRSVDYYEEGSLLWLEADTIIRTQTKGARSLDDFLKAFYGGADSAGSEVQPYELADIVAALNALSPYDWSRFFNERVYAIAPHAPVQGIVNSGWKMELTDTANPEVKAFETLFKIVDLSRSLGIVVKTEDGTIVDVFPGTPADKAGLAPGSKLLGLNNRRFKPERLDFVLDAAKKTHHIDVLVENAEVFQSATLSYSGGKQSPTLVRNDKLPDMLTAIITPIAH